MAIKCQGHRDGVLCAVRFTCLHWLDQVLGDELRAPKSAVAATGCAGYKRMSIERFKDEYRKNAAAK
jgi:hypothetical protein